MRVKQINLRKLWLSLLLLVGATAIAVPGIQEVMDGNVAKIGSTKYATLQAAFDAAQDGETVMLLSDYSATGETNTIETNRNLCVTKSITIDGQNHTLTVNKLGIAVKGISSKIDVTFKDITIQNSSAGARCIDTRGNLNSLTLENATLKTDGAPSGYTQPLTIGGSQSDAATVTITNSTIQTNDAGTAYYAITTFNPVNMTISNSTLKGWACIYAKGENSSAGSAGSVFTVKDNSTLVSKNAYSGETNGFSAIMIEDNNVTVNIENTELNLYNTGDQVQSVAGYSSTTYSTTGGVSLGEGTVLNVENTGTGSIEIATNDVAVVGGNSGVIVSGGTYDIPIPDKNCAEGYIPTDLGNGKYGVKEGTYVAEIVGGAKYESLQAAINAAAEGNTVTLLTDINMGATAVNIDKGITIDGDSHTITSTANAAVEVSGTGNVTISNTKINATNGRGIQVGNVAHYSGQLTINEGSVITVAKRGINILDVDQGFALNVDGSIIQTNVADPTTTYTTGEDSRGINFSNDPLAFTANITDSEIRGFSYCTNIYSGTENLTLNISGGKTYGRDVVNNWGKNNTFNLDGVEVHGLNNQTGPTEAFACIVENTGSANNNYNINDCQFIATLSDAAINTANSSASEYMIDLRGNNTKVVITGNTSYTTNASEKGGFIENEPYIDNNTIMMDETAANTFANAFEEYKVVETEEAPGYTVNKKDYVAQINNVKYESLAKAVEAAQANDVITMIADDNISLTTAGSEITIDKPLTITGAVDESGVPLFTIYGSSNGSLNNNSFNDLFLSCSTGTVTISNVKFDGFGNETTSVMGHSPVFIGSSNSNAVIENVYINKLNCEGIHINGGTFTIKDCNIDCSKTTNSIFTKGICVVNAAQGSIENTTITGVDCDDPNDTSAAIELQGSGTIAISDCSIQSNTIGIATTPVQNLTAGTSQVTISNCTVESQNIAVYSNGDKGALTSIQSGQYSGLLMAGDNDKGLSISGGIFDDMPELAYCADGMIPTANTDESTSATYPYTVKVGSYVAEIDGDMYETLEAAFAAVEDGQTITLLADCSGNGIIAPQGKFTEGIIVDFAGYTYTVDGTLVGSSGTETQAFQLLKDNKITFKDGTIYSEKALFLVQNYSNLTLEGMTLTLNNENYAYGYTLSNNNGKVVIDGTTINANPAGSTAFDVCRYASYTSVNVTVKGESVINGDIEFDAGSGDPKDGANLTIEGGTITGNLRLTSGGSTALTGHSDKATVTKSDAVELAAPADYKWVSNGDGTSTLAPCEYVAQIEGGAKYESLEAAWAAVEDGQTITLLANTSGNGIKAPQGKFTTGITVDFAGYTYTMDGSMVGSTGTQTQAFQLLKDNKITFKNGTIYSEKALMLIQNYSDLTLEGMTLTLNNENYDDGYTLSNNNGNIVIDGTTINANPAGSTAFDVCRYSSYTSVNVTVKGDSKINGDIEFDAGSGDPKDGASLTVESGTITGDLRLTSGGTTALTEHADKAVVTKSDAVELAAPANFKWVSNGDGTSTLMPCDYICAIGTTKYETLAEAVAAAGTSETTITLLTEAATDGVISGDGVVVPSGSNITFDLNGLTYDASGVTVGSTNTQTQGFQLLKESNITFKNGTLKATSPTAQMVIQNYSNLTLEDVTIDGTGLSGWAYALSNNCGTINLTGSTSITAKSGGRAFDTCKFGSYAIPTVNINTTGTITGPIEATGGKLNIENGQFNVTWVTDNNYAAGDIQIKGGVFSAEPAEEYCAKGYVATDNEDEATKAEYPFAVMTKEDAGIFELIDGKVYPYLDYTEDKPAASVTYKRNFANYNWQALFIPFDINDVTKLTDKYEFAKVHMVALENDGTFTTGNKIEIYYTRVTSGKLSANQPYLIKLKNEAEQGWQDIVVENTILKDTHNMTPRKTSTMAADYYFTGTYEGYVGEKYHDFMAMGSGTINWGNTGHKLGTYRWYIKTVPFNDDYAKTTISFIEADEDATSISAANADENTEIEGYYSVNGVRSDVPVKGMNIVKYKNGKTKKIMIK